MYAALASTAPNSKGVGRALRADINFARSSPLTVAVAVHGDFNFATSSPLLLHRPGRRGGPGKGHHAQAAKWSKLLALLT
eukprot:430689-Pyramimonas_sp.AAC.1